MLLASPAQTKKAGCEDLGPEPVWSPQKNSCTAGSECGATAFHTPATAVPDAGEYLWTRGTVMTTALLCATAAAALASVSATAHAQTGWYGTARVGAVVDGTEDIDATPGKNGKLDVRAKPQLDPVLEGGFGYGFAG